MADPVTVTGTIVFPEHVPEGPPATIHVRVEDVSLADASATVIAGTTLANVTVPPPAGEAVTFAIPVETYDPRKTYGVRVHVDRDGDGQVSVGDLVSTTHHPVLTRGGGTDVSIPVSEVAGQSSTMASASIPPVVWELTGFMPAGGDPVEVAAPAHYTLQFLPNGRVAARLDCTQGSGGYTADDFLARTTPTSAACCMRRPRTASIRKATSCCAGPTASCVCNRL
jgi:uncharacterized lipoprotein YbaY